MVATISASQFLLTIGRYLILAIPLLVTFIGYAIRVLAGLIAFLGFIFLINDIWRGAGGEQAILPAILVLYLVSFLGVFLASLFNEDKRESTLVTLLTEARNDVLISLGSVAAIYAVVFAFRFLVSETLWALLAKIPWPF